MTRIIFLLALLTAFPPLSTDMYLPAIPTLKDMWHQPLIMINLTLICFFLTYCLFMLIYGPISDRYGRRKPLLFGVGIFIVAGFMCAAANNIYFLIGARVLQASGAASASALSLAMCKDLFDVDKRERVMAYIAVIVAIAPMLSPIIGSWLIHFFNWRFVFLSQAFLGIIAWIGVFFMTEPLKQPVHKTISQAAGVYFRLFRNLRFTGLVLAISILVIPFFGFLAGSSEIYITHFGLDERQFGYFFGFNAMASMLGPMVFSRMARLFSSSSILTVSFSGIMLSGIVMMILPHESPWSLALPMWCVSFFFGMGRPPSNNLILEQVDHDVGAAAALIIFFFMTIGALSMGMISYSWPDKIMVLGISASIAGAMTLGFWLKFKHRF